MTAQPTAPPPRRPRPVTAAVVLVYVVAIAGIVLGVLVLLARYATDDPGERLAISLVGIGIALFGLLCVSVASGLARGSRLSQVLITVFAGVELAMLGAGAIVDARLGVGTAAAMSAGVALVVLLWLPTSRRYFRRAVPATAD